MVRPNRREVSTSSDAITHCGGFLRRLEALLAQRDYLLADHLSLADVALAPFVRQFAGVDPAWWSTAPWPATRRWLQAWLDSALFERVMVKQVLWVPQPTP